MTSQLLPKYSDAPSAVFEIAAFDDAKIQQYQGGVKLNMPSQHPRQFTKLDGAFLTTHLWTQHYAVPERVPLCGHSPRSRYCHPDKSTPCQPLLDRCRPCNIDLSNQSCGQHRCHSDTLAGCLVVDDPPLQIRRSPVEAPQRTLPCRKKSRGLSRTPTISIPASVNWVATAS